MIKLFDTAREIKVLRSKIASELYSAHRSMFNAQALTGIGRVEDISGEIEQEFAYSKKKKNIMGVQYYEITDIKVSTELFSHMDTSIELDASVKRFRDILPSFVKLVEKQLKLKGICSEIKRIRRKVNSLEYIFIPRMKKLKSRISLKLEEQERENFTRLKKIKENA